MINRSIFVPLVIFVTLFWGLNSVQAKHAPDWYVDLAADTLVRDLEQGNTAALDEFLRADEDGAIPQDAAQRVIRRVLVYEKLGQVNLDMLGTSTKASKTSLKSTLSQRIGPQTLRERMERVVDVMTVKRSSIFACKPREFSFPRDHGKHLRLAEWWYFHGHMYAQDGRPFGYELCFFKVLPCIYFCHVAVTDEKGEKFSYSRTFSAPWKVKVKSKSLSVKYGPCWAKATSADSLSIHGEFDDISFDLDMLQLGDALPIDDDGVVDMPEGIDSYYYSLCRLEHHGTLKINGHTYTVGGHSWMDHQWGNFYCLRWRWDWFALQMKEGSEYVIYRTRSPKDETAITGASIRLPDGSTEFHREVQIKPLESWTSPVSKDHYVTKWRLTIPGRSEEFTVKAVIPQQELPPQWSIDKLPAYWEGRCYVEREGDGAKGVAYCEHFPYNRPQN